MSGTIDIGHEVLIRFFTQPDIDGRAGLTYSHPFGTSGRCSGAVHFARTTADGVQIDGWTVEQEEPLTLSPSLLCRRCGHHGFIRNGQWVPA